MKLFKEKYRVKLYKAERVRPKLSGIGTRGGDTCGTNTGENEDRIQERRVSRTECGVLYTILRIL